ncbi:hypothetical protein CJ030_MR2G013135 [Morella rubra]|uniref:Uncharacterized protein n=1 Tax=Morella rubra TaxID=262757 RepID=A0A6A1W879_9ROSI|nr:hypothetical protein CJ030_MR2G013135 [Morella rubra]
MPFVDSLVLVFKMLIFGMNDIQHQLFDCQRRELRRRDRDRQRLLFSGGGRRFFTSTMQHQVAGEEAESSSHCHGLNFTPWQFWTAGDERVTAFSSPVQAMASPGTPGRAQELRRQLP